MNALKAVGYFLAGVCVIGTTPIWLPALVLFFIGGACYDAGRSVFDPSYRVPRRKRRP